jgi:hypothetical protein
MAAALHKVKLPDVARQKMDRFQERLNDIAAVKGIEFKYGNLDVNPSRPANAPMPGEKSISKRDAFGDGSHVFANGTMVGQAMTCNLRRLRTNIGP